MNLFDANRRTPRAELEEILLPRNERAPAQPEQAHLHPRADVRLRLAGLDGDLAAADIDLFGQREPGGLLRPRIDARWTVEGLDGLDPGLLSGRIEDDFVASRDAAALDGAGHDAS